MLNVVWMDREFDAYKFLALSITVSEIEREICEKIVILSYPLAFDAAIRRVPIGISAPPLGRKN